MQAKQQDALAELPPQAIFGQDGVEVGAESAPPGHEQSKSTTRKSRNPRTHKQESTTMNNAKDQDDETTSEKDAKEPWRIQKEALKEKFGNESWNPRRKLSPDAMEGIRALHNADPETFKTPVLANQFKVSPEAIRRILKSSWQPNEEETEKRRQRWDKRGEKIWSNLVEQGIRPPKKWREMGVGRAEPGEVPKWKLRKDKRLAKKQRNDSRRNSEILEDDDDGDDTPDNSVGHRIL